MNFWVASVAITIYKKIYFDRGFWTFHYKNAKFNTTYIIKLLKHLHTAMLLKKQLVTDSKTSWQTTDLI